jgi:hypothetical protein
VDSISYAAVDIYIYFSKAGISAMLYDLDSLGPADLP